DYFGSSVAGAGDVDADGFADLIVGAPYFGDYLAWKGSAYLFSGSDGHLLHRWDGDFYDQLGAGVSGAMDVNADGYDDVLIAAAGESCCDDAYALLVSGQTQLTLHKFTGPAYNLYGGTVASAGDLDSDGTPDILVGETYNSGAVHAYSGQNYTQLHVWCGTEF